MESKENEQLPALVREVMKETEDLLRLFDQAFLRTCGVVWEPDITEHPEPPARQWLSRRRHSG